MPPETSIDQRSLEKPPTLAYHHPPTRLAHRLYSPHLSSDSSVVGRAAGRKRSHTFIKDVNKMAEQPNGLVALQKRFLSDMLEVDNVDINDFKEGAELIKYEARRKRVLFILDNLNKLDQLNALARSRDWFGSGSRIVLETQFQQNLQMIKDMEETIRGSSFQAQIIAELQKNSKSSFPLYALDSTTDLLRGKGPETFEGYDDHKALLSIFAENEMIIGDANVNDQLKAKRQFLNAGSKYFNEVVSSESSSKALILRGKQERL
ncbi:hypothetical protein ACLB2K_057988 [Fragaria x ananassa]